MKVISCSVCAHWIVQYIIPIDRQGKSDRNKWREKTVRLHSLWVTFLRAIFYEKRISEEVEGDPLGEQYAGYIFKITGG